MYNQMKYIMNPDSRTPTYLQLYTLLRDDILKGFYPPGSKLPSKRTFATDCGVSTITVEHAYELLCDEGYIEARERSGYYVIFRADDGFVPVPGLATQISPYAAPHIDTDADFPFSVLAKTMRRVISEFDKRILDKSPSLGCIELRNAIRIYLAQSRSIMADTEQIIIGSGAEYLYSLLVELLGRDRIYAIESPSYEKIEQVYSISDVSLEKLPLVQDGIDSVALKGSRADVLHISPYRSYPSGVTATANKRYEYLRWAGTGNRYIIEDDFESEFSVSRKPEETLFARSTKDNVIYMNSFSMTISPSFRVGYMVLPKKLTEAFCERLGFLSCTVPSYIQFVLAELIANGDFERHINRVRRIKRKASTQTQHSSTMDRANNKTR